MSQNEIELPRLFALLAYVYCVTWNNFTNLSLTLNVEIASQEI